MCICVFRKKTIPRPIIRGAWVTAYNNEILECWLQVPEGEPVCAACQSLAAMLYLS
jgi:hypothetical protein